MKYPIIEDINGDGSCELIAQTEKDCVAGRLTNPKIKELAFSSMSDGIHKPVSSKFNTKYQLKPLPDHHIENQTLVL